MNTERESGEQDDAEKLMRDLLCACLLGDLEASDPEVMTVTKCVEEKKVCVRVECEKGEMALHKLARFKVTDKNKATYEKVFNMIIAANREQATAAGKSGIQGDINHQDKAGKTPLYQAIECKNMKMMGLLYGLGAEGPDSLLVNSVGWTVMHSAVNTDDLETIKKLVEHFTPARTKLLLATPDKSGREPLHIAAYKCTEDAVQYLISIGAKNARSDAAGNTAAKLAERAGRRRSRDIIEDPESAKAAGS